MGSNINQLDILTRREIEARIAGPLIREFSKQFGEEETLSIVKSVIERLAIESGNELAKLLGGDSLAKLAEGMGLWTKSNALTLEVLVQNEKEYSFNVTRCRYAEMYKDLGMLELGNVMSCSRDFAMIDGFNPRIRLSRTKTIMEGSDYCDFRFKLERD